MKHIVVDTNIFSLSLRHKTPNIKISEILTKLLQKKQVILIGNVRQEFLSGIKHHLQFHKLQSTISNIPLTEILPEDYDAAAKFYNKCRAHGIQGSDTDLLLCAVATRLKSPIFTTDQDFELYAKHLPISLFRI